LSQPGYDYDIAAWMPDGSRLMVQGRQIGKPGRCFIISLDGKTITPVTPEGVLGFPSEDGKSIISLQGDTLTFYPVDGGGQPRQEKSRLPNLTFPNSGPLGRYVIGAPKQDVPFVLYRYDTVTGESHPWKSFVPSDRAGVFFISPYDITPDGKW